MHRRFFHIESDVMASGNGRHKRQVKILHVLAKYGPFNAYKTWAKLVKEDLATQPTIRADLEQMVAEHLVKPLEINEKARGGRPSPSYELEFLGLSTLIVFIDDIENTVEDQCRFVAYLAKKYRDFMPSVFDLWSEFINYKADLPAFRRLQQALGAFRKQPEDSPDIVCSRFFLSILAAGKNSINSDHDLWLSIIKQSTPVGMALLTSVFQHSTIHTSDTTEDLQMLTPTVTDMLSLCSGSERAQFLEWRNAMLKWRNTLARQLDVVDRLVKPLEKVSDSA